MSTITTNKKIKIFQDLIDYIILKSIIDYLLISNKNKTNNNNNNKHLYKINKFYLNRNEILNYILVSKKWFYFISKTISNNIINNQLFEHWLKINYNNNNDNNNNNNQNQYDKNNLIVLYTLTYSIRQNEQKKQYIQNKIKFNKEFSIVKINESIINDYFKFNLFLDKLSIDDFKNFKNKFENNQLVYKRIVVNTYTKKEGYKREDGDHLLAIIKDILLNEKTDIFKIFELNYRYLNISSYSGFNYSSIRRKIKRKNEKKGNDMKSTSEFQFNNLSIFGFNSEMIYDKNTLKILKFYKCKSLIYDGSDVSCVSPTHVNLTPMFNPDMAGQQIESIKIKNKCDVAQIAEPGNLMKIGQFQNLHSIKFPIELNNILFGVSEGKRVRLYPRNIQENMKSELKKNDQFINFNDFIVYKYKFDDDCNNNLKSYYETISINQYLFDNIFSSPLTSIRHYKINLNSAQQLKFIFNLIINNIFKLQLYSLIFKFNKNKFFTDFGKEFNNLIIYLSTQKQQQQQQQQQSNNINLKEIKIKIKHYENCIDDKYIQELRINPYFLIVIKNLPKSDNGKIKTF
ncbi:hypothetical protein ACTFIR_012094 [Dictyostelium discoideum]